MPYTVLATYDNDTKVLSTHIINNAGVTIYPLQSFETLDDAQAYQKHCNDTYNIAQHIQHVETGNIYKTAYAAAKAVGAVSTSVKRHLDGVAGYKRVKGQTFRYV